MAVLGAMAGEPGFGLGDGALAYAGPGALAGTEPGLGGGFEDTDNGPILREPSPKLFTNGQKVLLLVFSVVAAGLVIATLFMSLGSGSGEVPPVQGQGQGLGQGQVQEARAGGGEAEAAMGEVRGPGEEEAAMKFSIPSDITSHHYIENAEAGMILVLTGLINNDNDRAVSFIRLKAVLADADNKVLAERHVFAGNLFTEEELKNLSMKEILSRLALKGGQNGTNTNVLPGKQVPYMFVFDKLPTDISNFTIAPVSSEPAAQT
jgi:hypothetical protein